MKIEKQIAINDQQLVSEISQLIQDSKQRVTVSVNAELTLLYWHIGQRISLHILQGERAEYGKEVIKTLSQHLTAQFGKGWGRSHLNYCVKFAETFSDLPIVHALRGKLSWTHFKALIYIDDPIKRDFYATMAAQEQWSTRTLDERIGSLLFERTAISKKPEETIIAELTNLREKGQYNQALMLKDPYILDFLDLNDRYLEKDLEDAILREIEQFLLELGAGFSFVARQKRIQIDQDDFYLDLLFYNRKLKCLVAIELKTEAFKAAHKSQMELYLAWLAKYEKEEDENNPIGIILCTGKKQEQIELLDLNNSGIHIAEYLTVLPPKELLLERLHSAVKRAKQRFNSKNDIH
ncbi:putative nuclease of restriction endonuclease-like (RecB) superfamily [Volucribacter psittacicida]|uniref:Putative nuclease of restriction endonuclease-like (RecB) superfamily n=1 Tax=Volucribacter psittacicida TaxID=203482 RepID=A0A4R1G0P4_9PAST|nr:PDDEXK nuclease domain-containing protein [Volucribacter psittacicida]TCJ98538.1 putative nuclease of restriction endonuclease-like (RecB) superfamily [Volucribacter psittacicida]